MQTVTNFGNRVAPQGCTSLANMSDSCWFQVCSLVKFAQHVQKLWGLTLRVHFQKLYGPLVAKNNDQIQSHENAKWFAYPVSL